MLATGNNEVHIYCMDAYVGAQLLVRVKSE